MFSISHNGIINVTRGDSFEIPVEINIGTAMNPVIYKLSPTDVLYLGIMEPNQPFETAIVRKKFVYEQLVDGNIIFKFWPDDTRCLLPGKYYYQVKLQIDEGNNYYSVKTVVDKTLFYINE